MAGGTGSRLWPLSREEKPKQFIAVEHGECMLLRTAERICEMIPSENCYVITNETLFDITRNTLEGIIPAANIILEPSRKNTAACIAYASLLLKKRIGLGLLCFVPADSYVKDTAAYKEAIELAYQAAEEKNGLVVIGIPPKYPATGYGYIYMGAKIKGKRKVVQVKKFVEKPKLKTAVKYLESGKYLWNSGIVVMSTDAASTALESLLPNHYHLIMAAVNANDGQDSGTEIKEAYDALPNISFDKGVLEKSDSICAVKGYFDWDDIGNIDALSTTFGMDENGNSVRGSFQGLDTTGSVIYSDCGLIATIGVENMIVAVTQDAVLVCPRDRVQDVKSLVELLKKNGYENLT